MLTESADDINRWSHEHAVTGVGVREISWSARQSVSHMFVKAHKLSPTLLMIFRKIFLLF